MSLDGTYSGLKASVADFLNRSDLTATIPDFITLAEGQMHRRFVGRVKQGMPYPRRIFQRADAAFAQSTEFIAVPDDFSGPINLVLDGTPEIVLDYLEKDNFDDWKASGTNVTDDVPKYYTVVNGEFQFFPVMDQAYTAELTYLLRFPALSNSNTTNWILTDYPDAYLYGALVQSAPYLKDDARLTAWGTLFMEAIDDICNADPIPSDKSTLRTEIPQIQRLGFRGRYDINSDRW